MAGFFPHTDIAFGNYTALSGVSCSGILDSIYNDISGAGGTVNGWSVVDDMRNIDYATLTGSYRTYYVWNNGRMNNANNGNGLSWTFTSGSSTGTCIPSYGYMAYFSFPYISGVGQDVQGPSDGQWYKVWSNTTNQFFLDRPYAGATTYTPNLITRPTGYLVLKSTGGKRDFHLILAQFASGTSGMFLMVEALEYYNPATRAGYNWGPWELARPFRHNLSFSWGINYVLCLYPGVFMLWNGMVGALGPGGMQLTGSLNGDYSTFTYVGDLDTSHARPNDKGAVTYITSDTSYSGFGTTGGQSLANMTTYIYPWGGAVMIRNMRDTNTWGRPGTYNDPGPNKEVVFAVHPRGRSYPFHYWGPQVDYDAKVQLLYFDLFQAGGSDAASPIYTNTYLNSNSEFYRGTLQYLRTFATNPYGMHLITVGPDQEGKSYIVLRASHQFEGDGSLPIRQNYDHGDPQTGLNRLWANGFSVPGYIQTPTQWGYITLPNNVLTTGAQIRYFAVEML